MPEGKDEFPKFASTLVEKTKCVAIGLDWTASNRTGVRIRADVVTIRKASRTCTLAALAGLSHWPALFVDGGDITAKYHKRILRFFSSVVIEPSEPTATPSRILHASGEVAWDPHELVEVLANLWGPSVN